MDSGKIPSLLLFATQAPFDLFGDNIGILLYSALLGQTRDRWLGRIPIAPSVHVQMRGLISKPPQRIAKDCHALPRLRTVQLYLPVFKSSVGGVQRGCR